MSWRVWTGKHQEEIRHLRGLIDEIMVICDNYEEGLITTSYVLLREIRQAIDDTQNEYEGASKDE